MRVASAPPDLPPVIPTKNRSASIRYERHDQQ